MINLELCRRRGLCSQNPILASITARTRESCFIYLVAHFSRASEGSYASPRLCRRRRSQPARARAISVKTFARPLGSSSDKGMVQQEVMGTSQDVLLARARHGLSSRPIGSLCVATSWGRTTLAPAWCVHPFPSQGDLVGTSVAGIGGAEPHHTVLRPATKPTTARFVTEWRGRLASISRGARRCADGSPRESRVHDARALALRCRPGRRVDRRRSRSLGGVLGEIAAAGSAHDRDGETVGPPLRRSRRCLRPSRASPWPGALPASW